MDNLDAEDMEKLIDRQAAALELFARQWVESSAADVVQSAFVKLANASVPAEKIVPWLYRVVRNGAVSAARSEMRRKRHEINRSEMDRGWFVSHPEDRLDGMEAAKELAQLPSSQREVIVARLWGELSFQEISELLEISSSAAHRYYCAGLTTLRDKLGVTWLKNNP